MLRAASARSIRPPRRRVVTRQQHFVGFGDGDVEVVGVLAEFVRRRAQAVPQREGQFDTARTAADDGEPERAVVIADSVGERVVGLQEAVDRFDRDGVLRAFDVADRRRRAGVDGRDIEADGRTPGHRDPACDRIHGERRRVDQPRIGKRGQRAQVDMRFRARIMARDVAGDHAGVGRQEVARDQGQPDPRFGAHAELLQYLDMAVSAAHEDDVGMDGDQGLHAAPGLSVRRACDKEHRMRAFYSRKFGGRGWESNPPGTSNAPHRF